MKNIRLFLMLALAVLTLTGCGKTNFLQWATAKPETDNIEQARLAIDEAKYDKALTLVADDDSPEARIIYAECLLGLSGVDLAAIIEALDNDAVADNPILRLESLVSAAENRNRILEAGNIFLAITPSKPADKTIGALSGLLAHTANLRNAFGDFNTYINARSDSDECVSEYNQLGKADSLNPVRYIIRSAEFLSSSDETLQEAIASAKAAIRTIDASIEFVTAVNATDVSTSDDVYVDIAKNLLESIDESIFKEFGYEGQGAGKLDLTELKNQLDQALNNDPAAKEAIANEIKDAKTGLPAQAAPWSTVKVLFGL
ncbi:MAG: hypothetical protein LBQ83_07615 [Candidatus Margulisbacteria bacterium]|jgi:hypothetical protein|nr:hypothetical protein [Candidatus Margulisiibacteriota bacterium]